MTRHRQQPSHNGPDPSTLAKKCLLTYKLIQLENARCTLDQELRHLTGKVYAEVQDFLNSYLPTCLYNDLMKTLDAKCDAFDKLLALLKDTSNDPQCHVQACAENLQKVTTNQIKLLKDKGILMTDVLKFGPMLQNVLMASSITKATQVLRASPSLQQLNQLLILQPEMVQNDVMFCSSSSSCNSVIEISSSSSHFKAKEKEHSVVCENSQPDVAVEGPAVIQSRNDNTERPPPFPSKTRLPEISNPNPMKLTVDAPLIGWGYDSGVQVQHQKQTSSQLLHFLRTNAKNMGTVEVAFTDCWNNFQYTSSLPEPASPTMKIPTGRSELLAEMENQAPVFKVKRVEPNGYLTYTCVIATKTELWDIGDILTDVRLDPSEASLEKQAVEECQNETHHVETSAVSLHLKTKREPEHQSSSTINHIGIPEFQIRKFEETEVVVSHIVSPGNFYIQHADCTMKLQALVTDLKGSSSFSEQNCIPDIGTLVMGWFPKQEQWCRSQVIKICGVSGDNTADSDGSVIAIKLEVRRLDFGDTACLSLCNIKALTPEMAVFPLQAVQVSLVNVMPVNGKDWSEEAVGWFRAMVHNRTLYARLYPQGSKVTVELFLERGKIGAMRRGASLSLRLAQNGHAKHDKLKSAGIINRRTFQEKMRKQADWEKYLISLYAQNMN
ncbi:uncharacterized protein LOC115366039 isoform X2 [Myripristis murdjan]|uniref:uncharacterized protein LOC115366039 isoform X2 n=1 Tax=Myripristis murdjan TaxID=586833 RepID=UPI0011763E77|nr:uncharacterized protein LOC115366039 isoform X2 [Myripristis murdjan]